jgi:glyceraldehyde 3-phosphate dehydrogenase
MKKIRVGLMGFGETPRHIYRLCQKNDQIEIVAIADIGQAEILHYLLTSESNEDIDVKLEQNFLISKNGKARIMMGGNPGDIPWDVFNVDIVIDGTGKYRFAKEMQKHIDAGASKVIITHLPVCNIDRVVIMGVNDHTIKASDKLISAGSATTNATAIILKILNENFGVDYAMLTTVHSYTSDQPLRDRVGSDYRRSRSAAENIIPNNSPSPEWIQKLLPEFKGRIEGSALNVPVPHGSLLDLTMVLKHSDISAGMVVDTMREAAKLNPEIIEVVNDPIVSTDVIGNLHSIVFDAKAIMKSPTRMIKALSWYHASLAVAARVIDVILAYDKIEKKGGAQ